MGYSRYNIEGKTYTIAQVVARVGCSKQTAYARLQSCDTTTHLLRPVGDQGPKEKFKQNKIKLDNPICQLLYKSWSN
jgi:transposase